MQQKMIHRGSSQLFCVEDMKDQYKIFTGTLLGSELSEKEKGKCRLEKKFTILKEKGILGKSKCTEEKVRHT